ncbi:unnamed protein product [Bursaphelenchus okinawaensis]|uniref:Uncharacterized protein n=1 Tax=Bursaphelenchus okinawaensis TaxID=465554 RepID=A0A811KWP7_9BILA|nr:unnamed protein product [Bursaphelenchus okinawaensis]CAG9112987.1 unnamed protein product [Bursaphelenchus okinawaensis]
MVTLTIEEQHNLFSICAPYKNCLKARLVNPVEIDGQLRTINATMKCEIWKKIHAKFIAKHPRLNKCTVKEIQVYYGCWKQKQKMLLNRLSRGETLYDSELDALKASGIDVEKFKSNSVRDGSSPIVIDNPVEGIPMNDTESASTVTEYSIEQPMVSKQEIDEFPSSSINDDPLHFRSLLNDAISNNDLIGNTPPLFGNSIPGYSRPLTITDALSIVDFCQNKDLKFEMTSDNLVFRPRRTEEDQNINIPIQLFKELSK